jgi:hypothetical protein
MELKAIIIISSVVCLMIIVYLSTNKCLSRLWKYFKKDKLCPSCRKNPADSENPDSVCYNCYYLSSMKGGIKGIIGI